VPSDAREAAEAEAVTAAAASWMADAGLDGLVALDDLVDPLMAEVEGLGNLTHRTAGRVQPPDRVVVVELRAICVVLELEEAGAELGRLGEYVFV
jgi:hypothetical protein